MRFQYIRAAGPIPERGEWRASCGPAEGQWWATRNQLHNDTDQEFERFDTLEQARAWCLEIFPKEGRERYEHSEPKDLDSDTAEPRPVRR